MATHSTTAGVGSRAPDFALPDRDGTMRTLDELRGGEALVLVFLRGFA